MAITISLVLAACGGGDETSGNPPLESPAETDFRIAISAFEEGAPVPARYSCEGDNISPEITWSGVPAGANSFAVIMDDPDAPRGVYDHWVLFNLPPNLKGLAENVAKTSELDGGGVHGRNSTGNVGYVGPCPPPGDAHTYRFFVYALDQMLELDSSADKQALFNALTGHILADGRYTGTYQR